MTTCQYYLKRTKTPRICAKKIKPHQIILFRTESHPELDFELHLCSKYFGMIVDQIRKKFNHSAFFNFRYDDSLCNTEKNSRYS